MKFFVPVFEPLPPQYFIRVISDRWIGQYNVSALVIPTFSPLTAQYHLVHTQLCYHQCDDGKHKAFNMFVPSYWVNNVAVCLQVMLTLL